MFKGNVAGRLRNTVLGRERALFPLFEAVVNSFHAIEETGEPRKNHRIDITATRETVLTGLGDGMQGAIERFEVRDTGVGFNEKNLDSFLTSDSLYKSSKGGKGIGRFIWLKAFEYAEIESHFRSDDGVQKIAFTFSVHDFELPKSEPSSEPAPRTIIRLIGMKDPYREHCPKELQDVAHAIIEHCLPFFIDPDCPQVTLKDETGTIDLNAYYAGTFQKSATKHKFQVGGHDFELTGLRLRDPHRDHRLIYAAHYREVVPERLDRALPTLRHARLDDEDGNKFVYLGFLEGEYLDTHVNNERTGFTFPLSTSDDVFGADVTLEALREGAAKHVASDLQPFLDDVRQATRDAITNYVETDGPEYRPMLRYIHEIVDKVAPNAPKRTIDLALHAQMYEKQRALRQESHELIADAGKSALKPEDYEKKLNDFIERANELGKSSLAKYVAHRMVMLQFLEKSLQSDPATGRYQLEETIHKIIYPMRAQSEDVPYEQQNLWIIDERLAYHAYLTSDLPLSVADVLKNPSDSRPDLMIFDRALSFSETESPLTSLTIVEFKKPARSGYRDEDPVDQVYRLVNEIRSGHFKDKHGREIKVQSDDIPAYAYVICDTTKEIEKIAKGKMLLPTPDKMGFFGWNPNYKVYVEVISYPKLLRDAQRRNKVLFDKLNLSPGS